jgi:hypothetical protein
VLVEAAYEPGVWVRLTFDQAINIDGLALGSFHVFDVGEGEPGGRVFGGMGVPELESPTAVRIDLEFNGSTEPSGTRLVVGAETGIVPAGGGAAWPGGVDLPLPFP